jgi:hypothetical protein
MYGLLCVNEDSIGEDLSPYVFLGPQSRLVLSNFQWFSKKLSSKHSNENVWMIMEGTITL